MSKWQHLIEGKLEDIPYVRRIIDTKDPSFIPDHALHNIGIFRGNKMITWHVSDDVTGLKEALRKGVSLMKAGGKSGDLGAGLYVSAIPHYWASRSTDKWSFLMGLSKKQLNKLTKKLNDEAQTGNRLTQREKDQVARDTKLVNNGTYNITTLKRYSAGQFGFKFWKPSWLASIGVKNDMEPKAVEVHLSGRFAELDRNSKNHRLLRRAGISGAYTNMGMSTTSQLVVWDASAITFVGDPEKVVI